MCCEASKLFPTAIAKLKLYSVVEITLIQTENVFIVDMKGATNVHTAGLGQHLRRGFALSGFEDKSPSSFEVGNLKRKTLGDEQR
jgi:hypothetical protein